MEPVIKPCDSIEERKRHVHFGSAKIFLGNQSIRETHPEIVFDGIFPKIA